MRLKVKKQRPFKNELASVLGDKGRSQFLSENLLMYSEFPKQNWGTVRHCGIGVNLHAALILVLRAFGLQ